MAMLDTLPTIITGPGDYVTRSGQRVTIREVTGPATFAAKGALWSEFRGKMTPRGHDLWHVSGRYMPLTENKKDVVGPWSNT